MARLVLVLSVLLAAPSVQAEAVVERASLRLRYGVALRDGRQVDVGPGVTHEGLTPNDLAVVGTGWLGTSWFGAWAEVQREGFDLRDGALRITGGSLSRASVGPRARVFVGPLRAELGAGYGFAQLPHFHDSAAPVLLRGVRHAAVVNGAIRADLPLGLGLEARAELPVALAVRDALGERAEATGFSAGGALLVPLRRAETWTGTLVLDFQHVQDTVTLADGTESRQQLRRLGAALELAWHDGARTPRPVARPVVVPGRVTFRVLDASTGAPLPGARVVVGDEELLADALGQVDVASLPPGPVSALVSAEGYAPTEATATVEAGVRSELEVHARPLPPATGSLRVTVVNALTGVPLPGVPVSVGAVEARTDLAGQAWVEALSPGPVSISVKAAGFRPAEEAAFVVAGQEATLSVPLAVEQRKGVRATLAGQVRSARGGQPLAATLLITKARVRARTDAKGAFNVQVRGGTYRITISARGHLSQTKVVTLRDGERTIFNVDLFPRGKR